jgi:hypothetical protein
MTPEAAAKFFTRSDGSYLFARWGRPIAPVLFGVEDETIGVFKGALEAMCVMTGHTLTETDPELGANMMVFFVRNWQELLDTPNLDRLVTGLPELVARLRAADANQYRIFSFDNDGGIRTCFIFLKMDVVMADIPADTLCLGQVVQSFVLWSDDAFVGTSPLALIDDEVAVLKPDVAAIIKAAYDPVMPISSDDPTHAHRLAARAALVSTAI